MKKNALFLPLSTAFLMLSACVSDDPRGYHPVEIGNTSNQTRMVREGRDTQTYMNTKMPSLDESGNHYSGEMPEAKIHDKYSDTKADDKINDKIDFSKI